MSPKSDSKRPGGRNGQSKSRNKSSRSSGAHKSGYKSKKEYKFSPLDSRYYSPQATYVSVLEHLETEITKTFEKGAKDVAESLVDGQRLHIPKPTLKRSTATDPEDKTREDTEYGFD
jgi:hypothetical protein